MYKCHHGMEEKKRIVERKVHMCNIGVLEVLLAFNRSTSKFLQLCSRMSYFHLKFKTL